jgi:2-methylcitrate dehydratase PrpD
MYATEVFARYATSSRGESLDAEVLHHAKRAVIDWYASLYPGLETPAVRALELVLTDDLDRGSARLVRGRAATPRAAALIHGTSAHAAEVDDSFREAMYHPGAATIAAALAAGQSCGATGPDLLRSVVLGYEISTRIGVALGRAHYKYWHNTGTVGAFGAAAAAGSLLGLDEKAFANALALVGTFSAGLQQAFRLETMAKPLHAGRAAEAGLLAAQLAERGVRSSLDVLDGDVGIGRAMSTGPDWSEVGASLGRDFHIARLTFKNHIGCGHTFQAIDGALELQRLGKFTHTQIERLHVATYRPALDIACYVEPRDGAEARFSVPYVVATALVHGSVRMAAYEPARLDDPATRALMKRIATSVDPAIDAAFPGRRAARVDVVLTDGRRFSHLQPDRKGDPELPLSDAELGDKLIELSAPMIGESAARALLARLWTLDTNTELP